MYDILLKLFQNKTKKYRDILCILYDLRVKENIIAEAVLSSAHKSGTLFFSLKICLIHCIALTKNTSESFTSLYWLVSARIVTHS